MWLANYNSFHMLQRTLPAGFIAPCLPTKTDKLPSGSEWLHEIKHDGFRIIAPQDCSLRAFALDGVHLFVCAAWTNKLGARGRGFATPTGSAGHAGATASLKLTIHLDHSVGRCPLMALLGHPLLFAARPLREQSGY